MTYFSPVGPAARIQAAMLVLGLAGLACAAPPYLVRDINRGGSSDPAMPWNLHGLVFFTADGINGHELWISDGTAEGTVLVMDLNAGPEDGYPHYFGSMERDEEVYFSATDGVLFHYPADASGGLTIVRIEQPTEALASFHTTG